MVRVYYLNIYSLKVHPSRCGSTVGPLLLGAISLDLVPPSSMSVAPVAPRILVLTTFFEYLALKDYFVVRYTLSPPGATHARFSKLRFRMKNMGDSDGKARVVFARPSRFRNAGDAYHFGGGISKVDHDVSEYSDFIVSVGYFLIGFI
jgi:hypothetical protein